MKDILKYFFFLVLGILIFIVYNTKDGFSVGIPVIQFGHASTPIDLPSYMENTDIEFTYEDNVDTNNPNIFYFDPSVYGIVVGPSDQYITLTTDIINRILLSFDGNPNYDTIDDILRRLDNNRLYFTNNRQRVGGLGMPPDLDAPRPGARGFGQSGGSGGGSGGGPGGGPGGGLFSILLNRCAALVPSIGIDISESSDTDILDDLVQGQLFEIPNIREFHFSEGVPKNVLESTYRYIFGPDIMDGVGGDYRLYDVDDTDYKGLELREQLGLPDTATHDECVQAEAERHGDSDSDESMCDTVRDRLKRLYTQSGNSQPSYALSKNAWGTQTLKLYYLTFMINGVEYLVTRALISISGDDVELKNITTLPQGYGYGTKLMELLATLRTTTQNPDYISQINTFIPLCIIPYRNMFRKSVTDWPTIGSERFSIFNPITTDQFSEIYTLMNILYFKRSMDYDYLYHNIYESERDNYNPINRSHFNLFLMGLDEGTITGILSNLNRQNLSSIIILYTRFLLDNNFPPLP